MLIGEEKEILAFGFVHVVFVLVFLFPLISHSACSAISVCVCVYVSENRPARERKRVCTMSSVLVWIDRAPVRTKRRRRQQGNRFKRLNIEQISTKLTNHAMCLVFARRWLISQHRSG